VLEGLFSENDRESVLVTGEKSQGELIKKSGSLTKASGTTKGREAVE
jgi:hypothetical protein